MSALLEFDSTARGCGEFWLVARFVPSSLWTHIIPGASFLPDFIVLLRFCLSVIFP